MPGLSEFSALDGEPEDPEGRFGRAQREDPNLQPALEECLHAGGGATGKGECPSAAIF